jgi:hypothetical protein
MSDQPTMSSLFGGDKDRPELPEDLLQWVFHQDFMVQATGRPINTRYLCQALRDLRAASYGVNVHEVRLAWQMLLDTAGPQLTGMFIRGGDWKRFAPPCDSKTDTPSNVTVWKDFDHRVVVRRQFVGEVPTDISFSVESL